MKKFLAILLACVVIMSLGVSAFAVDSPGGSYYPSSPVKTSALPKVVGGKNDYKMTEYADLAKLDADAQEAYKDAKKAVKDGAPDGMSSKYFFYFTAESYPYDLVVEMKSVNEASAKLFNNGKWEDLNTVANGDDFTVTVTGPGPVSIYTK